MDRPDRDLEGTRGPGALTAWWRWSPTCGPDFAELAAAEPGLPGGRLEQHSRLLSYLRAPAFGPDARKVPAS